MAPIMSSERKEGALGIYRDALSHLFTAGLDLNDVLKETSAVWDQSRSSTNNGASKLATKAGESSNTPIKIEGVEDDAVNGESAAPIEREVDEGHPIIAASNPSVKIEPGAASKQPSADSSTQAAGLVLNEMGGPINPQEAAVSAKNNVFQSEETLAAKRGTKRPTSPAAATDEARKQPRVVKHTDVKTIRLIRRQAFWGYSTQDKTFAVNMCSHFSSPGICDCCSCR